jgi:outer membrane protein assembly factor BamC
LAQPVRLSLTAVAAGAAVFLGGCSSLQNMVLGDKIDYRSQANKTEPLEVPPDLTQLARDGRYRPPGGTVTASGQAGAPGAAASPAPQQAVAPAKIGNIRVEREGMVRWLVVPAAPEAVWPQVRAFWLERGFQIEAENAQTGVMETGWAENRARIPQGFLRSLIGRALDALYSTAERDRFRTRLERTAAGTEVYVSHRGMVEVYTSSQRETTVWQPRPADPELEAEMLSRLMVKLGAPEASAPQAVAQAAPAPARPRAPAVASTATSLEFEDSIDRAWRRVGLALDRSGFTVEDRDRAAGVYFVRYVDPATAGKDEPGFLSKLFGGDGKGSGPVRYRVLVKAEGTKVKVSVQTSQGAPETGTPAQQIIGLLTTELR